MPQPYERNTISFVGRWSVDIASSGAELVSIRWSLYVQGQEVSRMSFGAGDIRRWGLSRGGRFQYNIMPRLVGTYRRVLIVQDKELLPSRCEDNLRQAQDGLRGGAISRRA